MVTVFIGLGSNLDDPLQQVKTALTEFSRLPKSQIIALSSLYRSKPLGPQDQPDYINAVAALETNLTPEELLTALQSLENLHGRVRREHWGPRTLDLDILLYGGQVIRSEVLTIPHPGLYERNFVLYPLAEIAADRALAVAIPGPHSLQALLETCDHGGLERLTD